MAVAARRLDARFNGDAMIAGFCVHDELALMVVGGLTPLAALQTDTVNLARYLGRETTLGTIGAGKSADLVLLDANPLEDIDVRRVRAWSPRGTIPEQGHARSVAHSGEGGGAAIAFTAALHSSGLSGR
jgi:adenine deaminase